MHGGRIRETDGRRTGTAVANSTLRAGAKVDGHVQASSGSGKGPTPRPAAAKLSKDAYRRRKAQVDEELGRLLERKRTLESALQDPGVHGNFVELRRVTGDLAIVNEALAAAEEAWLEMEEAAP